MLEVWNIFSSEIEQIKQETKTFVKEELKPGSDDRSISISDSPIVTVKEEPVATKSSTLTQNKSGDGKENDHSKSTLLFMAGIFDICKEQVCNDVFILERLIWGWYQLQRKL